MTGRPFAADGRPESSRTPVGPPLPGWTAAAALVVTGICAVAVAPSLSGRGGGLEDEQGLVDACEVVQAGDLDPAGMAALFQRALLPLRKATSHDPATNSLGSFE